MKKGLLVLSLFLCVVHSAVYAQVTGVKNIPGDYATLAAAITDLNTNGVGAGGATINVNANQTAPSPGYNLGSTALYNTLSATNPLIINGNGNSISGYTGTKAGSVTSATNDAILVLTGVDFVTIKRINFLDLVANITTTTCMDNAIGIYNAGTTAGSANGCQNILIDSCVFNLKNQSTSGSGVFIGAFVYASGLTSSWNPFGTTPSDMHRLITISNSNFNEIYNGVVIRSPTSANSQFVTVTNNIFNNYGGGTATSYGIYQYYHDHLTVTNNSFIGDQLQTSTNNAIFQTISSGGITNIEGNSFNIRANVTASQSNGVSRSTYVGANYRIAKNTFTVNLPLVTTGVVYPIILSTYSGGNIHTVSIDSNKFENFSINTTGAFYPIYVLAGSTSHPDVKIRGNEFRNITRTSASGTSYMVLVSTNKSLEVANNIFDNIQHNSTTTTTTASNLSCIYSTATFTDSVRIFNNDFRRLRLQLATTGATNLSAIEYANNANDIHVYNNKIFNLRSSTATTGASANRVYGIFTFAAPNKTMRIYNNIVDSLSSVGNPADASIFGIYSNGNSALASSMVYNNIVKNLFSPNATKLDNIYGIIATNPQVATIAYNTVSLKKLNSSSSSTFGASGIAIGSATTIGSVNNNIVNMTGNAGPTGGALSCLRVTTTGTAGTKPINLQSISNNIYHIDSGSNEHNFIFAQGLDNVAQPLINAYTNYNYPSAQGIYDNAFNTSCGLYKSWMGESGTFFENNLVTNADSTMNPTGNSFAKNGALNISAISQDFNGASRPATPDIGAIQFTGTNSQDLTPPSISYTNILNLSCTTAPSLSSTILDISGVNSTTAKPRMYFKESTENNSLPATNTSTSNGWKFVEATGTAPNFTFNLNYSLLSLAPTTGSVIEYFVVAQDNASTPNLGNNQVSFPLGFCPSTVNLPALAFPVTSFKTFSINPAPSQFITANPDPVCYLNNATLDINIGTVGNVNVGLNNTTITSAAGNPFRNGAGTTNHRIQYLISANEFNAANILPGNINSLSMVTTSANTNAITNYEIRMGHTATTNMTTVFLTQPSTLVYSNPSLTVPLAIGPQLFTFSSPFVWNGTDNVVIEICYSTVSGISANVQAGAVSGMSTPSVHATTATCGLTATGATNTIRPFFIFNTLTGSSMTSYLWRDTVNNTVGTTKSVVVQPSFAGNTQSSQKYRVIVTDPQGCQFIDSITVNKNISLPTVVNNAFNVQTPCYGDSIAVTFVVADGCPPYSISYKRATTLGGTTTPLILSSTKKFFPTGDKGYVYADVVDNAGNPINNFLVDSFDLPNPPVAVHDTICGTGTLTLGANPIGSNNVYWFDGSNPNSDNVLSNTTPFTTNILTQTDTFYAGEGSYNNYTVEPGVPTTTGATTTVNNYAIKLRVKEAFVLDSVGLKFTAALTNPCSATFVTYDSISNTVASNFVNPYDTFIVNVNNTLVTGAGTYYFAPDRKMNYTSSDVGKTLIICPIANNCTNFVYYNYSAAGLFNGTSHLSQVVDITGSGSVTTAWYNVPGMYHYAYIWGVKASKYCGSQLSPVYAVVETANPITFTQDTVQICNPTSNTSFDTVKISSTPYYTTFAWTSSSGSGSAIGNATNGWRFQSTAATPDTFVLQANNTTSGCQMLDTVIVNPVPFSTTINLTADLETHCLSGASKISLNGTPKRGASYQWQKSTNGGTSWSNIVGSISDTLQTGLLFDSTDYRAILSCNGAPIGGGISPSPIKTIFVHNPMIDSVKNDTICGVGTADLQAFANTGNVQWYDKNGSYLSAGSTYTTPTITKTDTFFAKATTAPGAATSLFTSPTPSGTWTTNNGSNGLMFNLTPNVNINLDSILGRTTTTTTQNVNVYYKLGTYLGFETNAAAWTQVGGGPITAPYNPNNGGYVQIGLPGGGLQLNAGQTYGIFVSYTAQYVTGIVSPSNLVYSNPDLSFEAGAAVAAGFASQIASRVFTGKFVYKTGCQSSATPVIAYVQAPPALTLSQVKDTVCSGAVSDLIQIAAPSTLSTYNTYTWNTTDVTGTQALGYTFNQTLPGTYRYILEAEQTSGLLCKNQDTFDFVVNRNPTIFNIDPIGPVSQCNGSSQELRATSGFVAFDTVGAGTASIGSTTGNPYRNGAGSTTHRLQYLVTQAELSALSFAAGDFTSLAFKTTSVNTGAISNYVIKLANTTATNLSTTFLNPTFTTVFNAPTFGPVVIGWNTHTFSTPFTWNGTDNILIELCYTTVSGTTANVVGGTVTGVTIPTIHATAATCGVTATGSTSASRPNIQFSQNNKYPITWSPTTGLFRNATTTLAYSGTNRDTVWAAPTDTVKYFATATHPNGCTINDSIVIQVKDTVQITTQPKLDTAVCQGQSFAINVTATSSSPLTYQWKKWNGTSFANITGANSSTFSVSNAVVTDSGNYICEISTGSPCATKVTSVTHVKVSPSISITTQPLLANVCQGQPFSLIAAASGDSSIMWTQLTGSNTSSTDTLAKSSAALSDSGMYFVTYKAFAPCADKNSDTVKVTVFPASFVSTDPVASIVCSGTTATFIAKSKNSASVSWMKGTSAVSAGGNIAISNTVAGDSTVSILTISNATLSDSGDYKFVSVTGGTGCANDTSAVAKLTVIPAPVITTQPTANTTICLNTALNLSVTATNASGFKWMRGTDSVGNASNYSVTNAQLSDSGNYTVVVLGNSPCASITSNIANVKVTPLATITTQPTATTVCQGSAMSFTIAASNADSIVWFRGTTRVGTGTTYSVSSAASVDSGNYRVIAYSASGCKNDTTANVLGAVIPAPVITTQPTANTTICLNTALNLSVTATNASGFKWMRGTDSVGNASSYSVTSAQLSDSGNYTVVVKGNSTCASITSNIANVKVTPLASITTQPSATTVCQGSAMSFTIAASNADSIVWFRGATRLGTGTTYSVSAAASVDSGNYSAVAYSASGCKNDTTANVLGAVVPAPAITTQPTANTTVCLNSALNLSVVASNASGFKWMRGVDSVGNGSNYSVTNAQLSDSGNYTVVVLGNSPCASITSNIANVKVTPLASITTQPTATTVCQGSTLSFTTAASNADSIVWFRGTTRVGTGTTYSVTSAASIDSANYSAVAYSASGCTNVTSNVVLGAVKPQATITTQPVVNTYVLTGTNASVSVSAMNFDSIVWYKGATRISNGATLSITNFDSATHAGAYTARVYSQAPCTNFITSTTANIIKSTCPIITLQPIGDTVCIGSTYALSVTAGAVNTYEWYKVGNATPIATTSSTTLNLNTLTSGGSYYVKLTPLTGCTTTVTSDTVNVGVDDSTRITAQPTASTTICEGSALNLSVTATGSGTLSYQWMNGSTNVGTNSNSFSVSSAATTDAGTYNVMVSSTSACPSATSSNAVVNVTPAATITTQPSASTICQGSTLSFTIAANNADSIVWFNGTTRVGTGTTFSQTNAQTTNSGNYVAIAYRGAGCSNVSSNSVAGTVNAAPAITTQPASSAFGCNGSNFNSLSVVASNATSYQWKQGSTNKGGTSSTISINPFTVSDTGNYTVVVSGTAPCADVTSTIANVNITDTAKIVTQPAILTDVCVGGTLRLKVVGNGVASYQWYKGTSAISGETKDSLVIANVAAATAGTYKVEAIAFAGCVNTTSSNAVVTISSPVTFTTQPAASTICENGSISLSTAVTGNSSPTYVWKKDGTALGAPSSTSYSKPSAMLSDSGNYTVEVTGSASCPTIVSNVAKVTINAAPTITAISGTSPLCVGSTLTLSATATNNNGVIWKKGTATVGTSSTYTKTAATSDAGNYTVTAVGKTGCADVTSAAFTQAITSPASITTQPVSTAVLTGSSFTLSVTASNANTYQWYKDGSSIAGETNASYTVSSFDSALHAGSYTVEITSNSPCTGTITSTAANVTKTTCPVITSQPLSDTLCAGSALNLSVTAVGANGYKWYRNNIVIPGATTSTYNVSNATSANSGTYRVEAIPFTGTTCGQIVSPDVNVLVESTPMITAQPRGNANCAPTAHTLRVTTSTTGHSYQWFKNGVAVSGATLDSLNVTTFTLTGDKYFVTMSGTGVCPSVSSDTVLVNSRNPQTQVRLVTNSEQNLVEQCTENNWTYYAKAGVPNEFLLAIRKNGNNVMFAPDIEINPAGITTLQHTANNPNGAIFGRRFFNIDLISGTLQYPYDVKFYYAPADTLEVMAKLAQLKAANASVTASRPSSSWITSTLVPFTSSLLSGVTSAPVAFANTIVSANSNGKDNLVDYVEITNLVAKNGGGTMFMDYTISSGSGISDKVNKGFGIEMYPVPAITELKVRLTSNTLKPVSFTITDMNGKVVMSSEERHQSNTSEHTFDISSFANGVYHIQLTNGETQSAAKFTVSK